MRSRARFKPAALFLIAAMPLGDVFYLKFATLRVVAFWPAAMLAAPRDVGLDRDIWKVASDAWFGEMPPLVDSSDSEQVEFVD